jgi:ribulose-phosphate 3-epimerase
MKSKTLRKILYPLPKISVSLLTSDLSNLCYIVKKLEHTGTEVLHLDVMDGNFVPNLTFGPPVIKSLRQHTSCFFDVHLMVSNPKESFLWYINSGADLIVFHYETVKEKDIKKLVYDIKKHNVYCGISIKPNTSVDKLIPYLKIIDLVLIMTVEPGFGGQKFLSKCSSKIKKLVEIRRQKKLDFMISCDGGINENNIVNIISLGCELPVIGSTIFRDDNFVKKTKEFHILTTRLKFYK